jgi:prepilin-type N-terminal cleavage/methylation domain-containing protein
MTTRQHGPRGGFTLVEILTALTILGLIGALFVRLIIAQSRFSEGQMALRNARTVSRNAMNIMLTDLRMVQDNGGLQAAARESVTVRVPVAFGLLCSTLGGSTMSLVPVDSAMTALAQYAGWAYRDSVTGIYTYMNAATVGGFGSVTSGTATLCTDSVTGPGILPVSYGTRTTRVITVTDAASGAPNAGWPVFVYQQITYKFDTSTAYPHRIGLFRIVKTNDPNAPIKDEIIAPFDTSAKFRFYVLNADTAQSDSPGTTAAALATVRGLQLVLAGASPRVPQGSSQAKQAALVTGVFFKNRRDP